MDEKTMAMIEKQGNLLNGEESKKHMERRI
jgi:hypothetical protein